MREDSVQKNPRTLDLIHLLVSSSGKEPSLTMHALSPDAMGL